MKRRTFIAALGGAVTWPVVARGQQQPKVWRIGMLETISADLNAANLGAFQQVNATTRIRRGAKSRH